MASEQDQGPARGLVARLKRTRFLTAAAIRFERAWPLALPLLVVASLFLSFSWLGLFRWLPDYGRIGLLAALAMAALAALYPLRLFRAPGRAEIDRRIELANRLEHEPVGVQNDRPAGERDLFAAALWREHQRRMAGQLDRLGADAPRTGVPQRDPWGMRAAAALLLVVAFAFSAGPLGGRVDDAFRAHSFAEALPARIDAWVTPPAYTGRAPIYMTADANRERTFFTVPRDSRVTLRVTGGDGEEELEFLRADGEETTLAVDPDTTPAARQFSGTLTGDGVLTLHSGGVEAESWTFAVLPDDPPTIRFAEEPRRAVNGALELAYEIEDDYGATGAGTIFEQADEAAAGARPLYEAPEMPLSLPRRGRDDNTARTSRDLTEHPWAGSRVDLTLTAVDAAGQESHSETKRFQLPERSFTNPLARAVIEQRRMIALDANSRPRVLQLIDAITLRPEDTFDSMSHYLGLMAGRTRLSIARTDDQLREVVDYFWELALAIEDGNLSAAEQRLRQAQQALRDALEQGATDEELEQLMAELREAMQEFLREFAERAMRNPDMAQQMPQDGQQMRQSDLDRLLDQIENLARSGARDEARDLLSQLENMMNNLQAMRPQQGQQGQQGEMRQQMDQLGDIMRRQQEMMNDTFRLDQMQRDQQGQQGQQGQMSAEELAEALRQLQEGQGQLQQDLGELMQGLEGLGIQPGEGFGEAGEAMGRAGEALGDAQGQRAVGEQGQALEALRRGAQDMMQQMQQAQQGEDGMGEEGGRQQTMERDPLGRPRATTGPDFGNTVEVPDEIDVQRAREILDAIRRRLGNALSPALERDYLERLLQMR